MLSLGATALGDDSGDSIGDGEGLGATTATDAAGLGELAAPALPADSRAIATRANATIIKPTRAACDTARSRGQAIRGDVSRGGSRITVAERATGRRAASTAARTAGSTPGAIAAARAPLAAPYVGQVWWASVRQSRRCLSALSGAGGSTAPQRCSRFGDALRQPPDSAMRYGQTVPVVGRSGWLP